MRVGQEVGRAGTGPGSAYVKSNEMQFGREAWKVLQTGGGRQSAVEANAILVHVNRHRTI